MSKSDGQTGECKLCGNFEELEESHIVPAFVFRHIRETGLIHGGGLRFSDQPNKVVQQGDKRRWLCRACETLFSKDEHKFSEAIFKPANTGRKPRLVYGPELLRFCVSLSWRTLLRYEEMENDATKHRPISDLDSSDQNRISIAEMQWKEYLIGKRSDPGRFIQHICIMSEIDRSNTDMSIGINKYILRATHQDILSSRSGVTVYTKIPSIVVFGMIRDEEPGYWDKTEVRQSGGTLPWNEAVRLPYWYLAYLSEKADKYHKMPSALSDRQKDRSARKVDQGLERDPERLKQSQMLRAIQADESLAQNQGRSTLMEPEGDDTMEEGYEPVPTLIAMFEEMATPDAQLQAVHQLRETGKQAGLKGHIGEDPRLGKYFTTGLTAENGDQTEQIEIRAFPVRQNMHGQVLVTFIAKCDYTGYSEEAMREIRTRLLEGNHTATFARYASVRGAEEETIVAVADAVAATLQPLEMFRLVFHVCRLAVERPRHEDF